MSDTTPELTPAQSQLITLVTNLITQKPTSKAEALELFHSLQFQLGNWIVSELPACDAKTVLVGLWALEKVQSAAMMSCLGK